MSWWFIWTSTPGKGKQKQKGKRKMTCAFLKKLGCWLTPFKPLCSVHVPALGKLSSFFCLFLGSPFKSARWHLFDIWEVFFLLLFNLYNLFASATLLPTRGHRPAWHHRPAYKTQENTSYTLTFSVTISSRALVNPTSLTWWRGKHEQQAEQLESRCW